MIKVNAKYILAALPHISTEATRYYLNGVFFEPCQGGVAVVATDGRTMFAGLDNEGESNESQIILIFEELAAACKAKRDDYSDRFVRFYSQEDETKIHSHYKWEVGLIRIEEDESEVFSPVALGFVDLIDETYPDWRRVLPSGDVEQSGGFNPALLVKFQKSAKALNAGQIAITQHGKGPALIGFFANSNCCGALMPMSGEHSADCTAWTRDSADTPLAVAAK